MNTNPPATAKLLSGMECYQNCLQHSMTIIIQITTCFIKRGNSKRPMQLKWIFILAIEITFTHLPYLRQLKRIYKISSEINVIDVAKIHSIRKQSQNNFTGLTAILKMWVSINEKIVIYFYYCSCLYSGKMLIFLF